MFQPLCYRVLNTQNLKSKNKYRLLNWMQFCRRRNIRSPAGIRLLSLPASHYTLHANLQLQEHRLPILQLHPLTVT
jgi:hypothetical protein